MAGTAKAVSVGSHAPSPHVPNDARAGITEGITVGTKNSIAAISTVLTIFRMNLRIVAPFVPVLKQIAGSRNQIS
jgi:hypothetical protein